MSDLSPLCAQKRTCRQPVVGGINSASDIPTSDTTRERNVATLEMMGIALPRVGRAPKCPLGCPARAVQCGNMQRAGVGYYRAGQKGKGP